jgi:predicted metal-dependent hydrolase
MRTSKINIRDIEVLVVRKDIKNLHLSVHPPEGRVRISVPLSVGDDQVRLAIIGRLPWIRKRQKHFREQPRQSAREMVTGESHYVFGKRYLLELVERWGKHEIIVKNNTTLQLHVRPGTTTANRLLVLNDWYRVQLKKRIPSLLDKWQSKIGVEASSWSVKRMRTRWGSCNIQRKRIWLNLELAKKPIECLEYVLVHELVHLLERHHNDRFRAFLDRFLPIWRVARDVLKREPLAYEDWVY